MSLYSTKLKKTVELFDLISKNGEIDHPLCEECTDSMLETMDQELKLAEEEAQEYQAYMNKLDQESESDSKVDELQKELDRLELHEKNLLEDLTKMREKTKKSEAELEKQIQIKEKLDVEEQQLWKEYSKLQRDLLMAEDDSRSLDCKLQYHTSQLERLKKMNAFNVTFQIWNLGHFATINGLRLGRLPSVPVEWAEINAAWGHTAFLLSSLAKAIGMDSFQRYMIVPYSSHSYIKTLPEEKVLPLYGSGGFRMIFDSKFDSAMVAFLDCLQQFAMEVEKRANFSLPYEMEKGKIRDKNNMQWYSIKLQFNSEESWTKALRYMLTNLKWGLTYVSTKCVKNQEEGEEDKGEESKEGAAAAGN